MLERRRVATLDDLTKVSLDELLDFAGVGAHPAYKLMLAASNDGYSLADGRISELATETANVSLALAETHVYVFEALKSRGLLFNRVDENALTASELRDTLDAIESVPDRSDAIVRAAEDIARGVKTIHIAESRDEEIVTVVGRLPAGRVSVAALQEQETHWRNEIAEDPSFMRAAEMLQLYRTAIAEQYWLRAKSVLDDPDLSNLAAAYTLALNEPFSSDVKRQRVWITAVGRAEVIREEGGLSAELVIAYLDNHCNERRPLVEHELDALRDLGRIIDDAGRALAPRESPAPQDFAPGVG